MQATIYFSDSSMPASEESEELATRSMADLQVSARLGGHPSKYWLRAALLDFGNRRRRAPTAHLPLSVVIFVINFLFSAKNIINAMFSETWIPSDRRLRALNIDFATDKTQCRLLAHWQSLRHSPY